MSEDIAFLLQVLFQRGIISKRDLILLNEGRITVGDLANRDRCRSRWEHRQRVKQKTLTVVLKERDQDRLTNSRRSAR